MTSAELPPAVAALLARFAAAIGPVVGLVGLYVGGSLCTGDFHPGISDLDLAAVVAAVLSDEQERGLRSVHQRMISEEPLAAKLHCVYVPLGEVADVAAAHPYWAHGELYRRPLTGVTRAELLTGGIAMFGPPPGDLLPAVSATALESAVRGELSGYWTGAIGKPWLWLDDLYVDLGLVTLARVQATLTEGRLITKREAITRLSRVGVPPELAREIAARRRGEAVPLSRVARLRRAYRARRVMAAGIRTVLAPPPPPS